MRSDVDILHLLFVRFSDYVNSVLVDLTGNWTQAQPPTGEGGRRRESRTAVHTPSDSRFSRTVTVLG